MLHKEKSRSRKDENGNEYFLGEIIREESKGKMLEHRPTEGKGRSHWSF